MKKFITALVLMGSFQSFAADITLSPVYTVVEVVRSVLVTALSPFASTTASVQAKEQMAAVRTDALNFLADESEASEVLSASIQALRSEFQELNGMSDKQIAALIVSAAE